MFSEWRKLNAPLKRIARWLGVLTLSAFMLHTSQAETDSIYGLLVYLRQVAENGSTEDPRGTSIEKIPPISCPINPEKPGGDNCFVPAQLRTLAKPSIKLNMNGDLDAISYSFNEPATMPASKLRDIFSEWAKTRRRDSDLCGAFQHFGKQQMAALTIEDDDLKFCDPNYAGQVRISQIALKFYRRQK